MKKLFSALCASVICLCGSSMYAFADEGETPGDDPVIPEYLYTASIESELSIDSSGNATGRSAVYGNPDLVTKIVTYQYLQWYTGFTWMSVGNNSDTSYSWYSISQFPYTITLQGKYRIRTVADVYCGNSYETVDCNSTVVRYP